MSVEMGERAISLVKDTLENNLPTEISEVNTEKSDNLPNPDAYYLYPRALAKDGTCYVEVWVEELGNFDITAHVVGHNRLRFDAQVNVRLTFINRKQRTPEQMHLAMQRYGAAIARVILENPLLESTDYSVQFATIDTFRLSEGTIEENGRTHIVNQLAAELLVSVCEVNS